MGILNWKIKEALLFAPFVVIEIGLLHVGYYTSPNRAIWPGLFGLVGYLAAELFVAKRTSGVDIDA